MTGRNPGQGLTAQDSTSLESELMRRPDVLMLRTFDLKPDLVVCVDWTTGARGIVGRALERGIPTVLIVNEPAVVVPEHSQESVLSLFNRVVFVGRPNAVPIVPWPQTFPTAVGVFEGRRIRRAVMIQARKYSFVRGQLYSLRARLVAADSRVHLFGFGWSEGMLRTLGRLSIDILRAVRAKAPLNFSCLATAFLQPLAYRGPAVEKIAVMSQYKVAVVIENSSEFMSEKLFDAFFAQCIPVYVGPPLENFGIPPHLYIRSSANLESLQIAISAALAMDYETWRKKLAGFLGDPSVRAKWQANRAISRIIDLAVWNS